MEKASLEHIRRLLKITEAEHNHELLLSMKNLWELGASPFRYIVPVIPPSFPEELVKGEHFFLADLLNSISGSSSQVGSIEEPQVEISEGALVNFFRPDQSHVTVQDIEATPLSNKRKGKIKAARAAKKGKIIPRHTKATSVGLEDFMDWLDPTASDPTKEREGDMSSLTTGFAKRMRKRAA